LNSFSNQGKKGKGLHWIFLDAHLDETISFCRRFFHKEAKSGSKKLSHIVIWASDLKQHPHKSTQIMVSMSYYYNVYRCTFYTLHCCIIFDLPRFFHFLRKCTKTWWLDIWVCGTSKFRYPFRLINPKLKRDPRFLSLIWLELLVHSWGTSIIGLAR